LVGEAEVVLEEVGLPEEVAEAAVAEDGNLLKLYRKRRFV
jgi:hypothetical protein